MQIGGFQFENVVLIKVIYLLLLLHKPTAAETYIHDDFLLIEYLTNEKKIKISKENPFICYYNRFLLTSMLFGGWELKISL